MRWLVGLRGQAPAVRAIDKELLSGCRHCKAGAALTVLAGCTNLSMLDYSAVYLRHVHARQGVVVRVTRAQLGPFCGCRTSL